MDSCPKRHQYESEDLDQSVVPIPLDSGFWGQTEIQKVKGKHPPVLFHLFWGEDLDQTVVPACLE